MSDLDQDIERLCEQRLEQLRTRFVNHPRAKTVLRSLRDLHQFGLAGGEARCGLLFGPSRVGKSVPLKHYRDGFIGATILRRGFKPVLYVELPSSCSIKSICFEVLKSLGAINLRSGTESELTARVYGLLRNHGVELLILDELQHLSDRRRGGRIAYDAADWIKRLLNERICPIVLSGGEKSRDIVKENPQLENRIHWAHELRAFDWDDEVEMRDFRKLLHSFEECLAFPEPSELANTERARRIHYVTRGLVGKVTRLLSNATKVATQRRGAKITDNDLSIGLREILVLFDDLEEDPFTGQRVRSRTSTGRVTKLSARGRALSPKDALK